MGTKKIAVLTGACILALYSVHVLAATPTQAELTAISQLPQGYMVYSGSSPMNDSIWKVGLGSTNEVCIAPNASCPRISFTDPNKIYYASLNVKGGKYFKIMSMDASGGNKTVISSSPYAGGPGWPMVTDLFVTDKNKIYVASSEATYQNWTSVKLWQVSLDGTVKMQNLGGRIDSSGAGPWGMSLICVVNNRFMTQMYTNNVTWPMPNNATWGGGIVIMSIDQDHPETAMTGVFGTSFCGPAMRHDASLAYTNSFNHDGLYTFDPQAGRDLTTALNFAPPEGGSYNFHYAAVSNNDTFAYIANRQGHCDAYVLNLTNSKLVRQTWRDNKSCQFGNIWIGPTTITQASTPVFSPSNPSFTTSSLQVTLSCATSNSSIYYTTNGSDPTRSSAIYSTPFTITATTTIKARAYVTGLDSSGVSAMTYFQMRLRDPIVPPRAVPGLYYKLYEGTFSQMPDFSALTPTLFGVADTVSIGSVTALTGNFAVWDTAYFTIPTDGVYTFTLNSNSGAQLYISDTLLITTSGGTKSGTIGLKSGLHAFDLRYFQGASGTPALGFTYSGLGISSGPIGHGIYMHNDQSVPPFVKILKPKGGFYKLGDSLTIQYYSPAHAQTVMYLSTDGGVSYSSAPLFGQRFAPTTDTATIKWKIPVDSSYLTSSAVLWIYDYLLREACQDYSDPFIITSFATGVNCGGTAAGDFGVDAYSSGGSTYTSTATVSVPFADAATAAALQPVFKTERYGNCTYTFTGLNVSTGYMVRLYMAEIYYTTAGQRTFSVNVNGTAALTNFDIVAEAGGPNIALYRDVFTNSNANGQITVQLINGTDNAKMSAIQIVKASGSTATIKSLQSIKWSTAIDVNGTVSVYTIQGKCIRHMNLVGQTSLSQMTKGLPAGSYIVKQSGRMMQRTSRFVVVNK